MAASVSMSSGSLRRGNPGGGPQTAERSTWSVLADSILGALYLASKKPRTSSRMAVLLVVVSSVQLIALAVGLLDAATEMQKAHAGRDELSDVSRFLSALTIASAIKVLDMSPEIMVAAWMAATLWTILLIALFVATAWRFVTNAPHNRLQLQLLRKVAVLSTSALVVPLISVQLTWISCSDDKVLQAVGSCWSGWHLPTAVLNIILLPLYVWTSIILTLAYVDHTLEAPTMGAKLHGRGDVGIFVCQLAVITLPSLFTTSDTSSLWIRLVAMALLAGVWLNAYVFWQPHVSGKMNDVRAGLGGAFAWAVFCVFCKLTWSTTPAATLLLVGLLPTGLLVALVARLRRFTIEALPIDKLQGAADIHRWALRRIKSAVKLTDKRMGPELRVAHVALAMSSSLPAEQSNKSSTAQEGTALGMSRTFSDTATDNPALCFSQPPRGASPGSSRLHNLFAVASAKVHPSTAPSPTGRAAVVKKVDASVDPSSKRLQQLQELSCDASLFAAGSLSGSQHTAGSHTVLRELLLSQAEAALHSATNQTSNGTLAFAHFTEALFQRVFRNSRYAEFAALRAAKAASPGFDVAFFVYQRHRQLNEAKANTNSSGEASLSAIDRLLYEQHSRDAADASLEWSIGQARLWSALAVKVPSVDALHNHTVYLAAALVKADEAYTAMRRLNPNSSALLRAVGQYLSSMQGDYEAGEQLTAQADRMEQVAMQRSQQVVPQFVFGEVASAVGAAVGETSAHLTVSGSQHSLGSLVEANTVASRLLGYSKQALLAKRMSDLFPVFLAEAFDAALFEYTSSGRGLDIDVARLQLVVHSSGHLVPVAMHIAEAPSVEDSDAVNFYVQLQILKLPHEFALVDAEAEMLPILGLSSGAAMLVDLSDSQDSYNAGGAHAAAFTDSSILRFIPEIDLTKASAAFGSGLVTSAREQLDAAAAANEAAEDGQAEDSTESPMEQRVDTRRTMSHASQEGESLPPLRPDASHVSRSEPAASFSSLDAWVFDVKAASKARRMARKPRAKRALTSFTGFKSAVRLDPLSPVGLRRKLLLVSWAEHSPLQADMLNATRGWNKAVAVAMASSKFKKALHGNSAVRQFTPPTASNQAVGAAAVTLPAVAQKAGAIASHAVPSTVHEITDQPSDSADEGSLQGFLDDDVPTAPTPSSVGGSKSDNERAPLANMERKRRPTLTRVESVATSTSTLLPESSLQPVVSPSASLQLEGGAEQESGDFSQDYLSHMSDSVASDTHEEAPRVRFALDSYVDSGSFKNFKQEKTPPSSQDDAGDGGKAGSVSSSVGSTSAKLRLGLSGITSRSAHPAAKRLSITIVLLALAALGVAIWHLSRISAGQVQRQRQIGTVLTNERRGGLVVKSALLIQAAVLAADRQISVFNSSLLAKAMLQAADELEGTTARLNRDLEMFVGQDTERLEAEKVTVNEVTVTGGRVPMNFTLTDACSWYVSHMRRVAPSIAAQDLRNPSVLTVLQSGQLVIRQALAASGAQRIALYAQVVQKDREDRQFEFFAIFIVLVFLTSLFIWIQMATLDAHRRKILKLLAFVPRSTAQAMKKSMQMQLQEEENNEDYFATSFFVADTQEQNEVQHAQLKAARRFKHSRVFQVRPGCFLTLPVVFVGCLLLVVFSVQESFRARMESAAQQAYLSHRSEERLYLSTSYIAGIGSPTLVQSLVASFTNQELLKQFDDLRAAQLDILNQLIQGTTDGPMEGVRTLPIARDSLVGEVLLTEACQLFRPTTPGFGDVATCRRLHSSVLTEAGLQGGVMEFLATGSRAFGTLLQGIGATLPPPVQALALSDAVEATRFAIPYMADILSAATGELETNLYALFKQELSSMIAIYVLFLLGLWALVFGVFIPFANKIGQQVTAVQVVLPLIPRDLVQSSKALKVHMERASRNIILAKANRDSARQLSIAAMMD